MSKLNLREIEQRGDFYHFHGLRGVSPPHPRGCPGCDITTLVRLVRGAREAMLRHQHHAIGAANCQFCAWLDQVEDKGGVDG